MACGSSMATSHNLGTVIFLYTLIYDRIWERYDHLRFPYFVVYGHGDIRSYTESVTVDLGYLDVKYVLIAINSCRADVNTDIKHITLCLTIFNEEASARMELRFILLLYIINPSIYIKEHACIYTTRREREKKKEKRMTEVAGRLFTRRNK